MADILGTIIIVNGMGMASITGKQATFTKGSGRKVNNVEGESIAIVRVISMKVIG